MSDPRTLPELIAALAQVAGENAEYFGNLPPEVFFTGDAAHWGPAHHLSHLTLSHKRVARAFGAKAALPAREPALSRSFAEIRAAYETGLQLVPRERLDDNPVPPRLAPGATQPDVVAEYAAAAAALRAAAGAWSEADADARAVPHPFLGALSAREMLCFIAIHDRHHLDGVRGRLGSGPAA